MGDLPARTRPPLRDSIIFEYIGWYLTRGGRLYLDVFEVKPPAPFELTAALTMLAGGDPLLAHGLMVGVTAAAAVVTALVCGALVDDLTGDGTAALTAGLALYVLPAFHWRAAFGFKVKYVVALLVLLAVLLARRDRPLAAGAAAGAGLGFWQLTAVGPVLAAGIAYQRRGRSGATRVVVAAGAVLVGIVAPVVYWGATEAMITETVLVPLLVGENLTTVGQFSLTARLFGAALPVALVGLVGVAAGARRRPDDAWWLAAGTGWFGLQVLLVDLDAPPDLFALMAFLAVGIGVLLDLETGSQRPARALVAVLAVTAVVTMGGFGTGHQTLYEPDPYTYDPTATVDLPYDGVDRRLLFWDRLRPETCRAFLGPTQFQVVRRTSHTGFQATCGDAGPVLEVLLNQWTGG